MKKVRFTEEQMVTILREAGQARAGGSPAPGAKTAPRRRPPTLAPRQPGRVNP